MILNKIRKALSWLTVVALGAAGLTAIQAAPALAAAPAYADLRLVAEQKDTTKNAFDGAAWWNDPAGTNYVKYNDVAATTSYTWRATDANGNPIANTAVSLVTSNAGGENAHLAVGGVDITPGSGKTASSVTDNNGYVTFAVTNTDDPANAENRRATSLPWEAPTNGKELKANFHPTMGAASGKYDGVWAHYVAAAASATDPIAYADFRLIAAQKDVTKNSMDGIVWWNDPAGTNYVQYQDVASTFDYTWRATDVNGDPIRNHTVSLAVTNGGGENAKLSVNNVNVTAGSGNVPSTTTDSDGYFTFRITSTDVLADAENRRPTLLPWTDPTNGKNLRANFHPTMSAAGGKYDGVWPHFQAPATDLSSDTTLSTLTVNGNAAKNGDSITLAANTTSVTVVATATSNKATVAITGDTGLVNNAVNTLNVKVTAEDGSTANYNVSLVVGSVLASATIRLTSPVYDNTNSFDATADATAQGWAQYYNKDLRFIKKQVDVGSTVTLTYQVLDQNSNPVVGKTLSLRVAKSYSGSNAKVNVSNGTETVSAQSAEQSVSATTDSNGKATFTLASTDLTSAATRVAANARPADTLYTQTAPLLAGLDEMKQAYDLINFNYVPPVSTDSTLSELKVNGSVVASDGTGKVEVANGTSSVTVSATATSAKATVLVTGDTSLVTGDNTVSVKVTAEDGSSTTYTFVVKVLALNANTTLKSLTVNGNAVVSDGTGVVNVETGTTSVTVVALATAESSSVSVSGASVLKTGDNVVSITVTAQDNSTATYTFKVVVAAPKAITSVTIRMVSPVWNSSNSFDATARATTEGWAQYYNAGLKYLKKQYDVGSAVNLTYQVLDQDGNPVVGKTVRFRAAKEYSQSNAAITITNGTDTVSGKDQQIVVTAVTNAEGKVTFTVTSTDSSSAATRVEDTVDPADTLFTQVAPLLLDSVEEMKQAYDLITLNYVAAGGIGGGKSSDATLKSLKVNSSTVASNGTGNVSVAAGTTSVTVEAVANSGAASVLVTGATGLVTGVNTLTVKVTAENGTVANYTFKVTVAAAPKTSATVTASKGKVTIKIVNAKGKKASISITGLKTQSKSITSSSKTFTFSVKKGSKTVKVVVNGVTVRKTVKVS